MLVVHLEGFELNVYTYIDHAVPIAILLLDYAMNRITFSFRLLPFAMILYIIYIIVLTVWTLNRYPVYKNTINFNDWLTGLWIFMMGVFEAGGFLLMIVISMDKMKKISKIEKKALAKFKLYDKQDASYND